MSEEVWSRCTPRDGTVGRGRDLGLLFPCCNPDALPVKVLWTGGFCELRCRSFCSLWQFPSRFLSSILCEFYRLHSTAPCLSSSYSFSLQALVSSGGFNCHSCQWLSHLYFSCPPPRRFPCDCLCILWNTVCLCKTICLWSGFPSTQLL